VYKNVPKISGRGAPPPPVVDRGWSPPAARPVARNIFVKTSGGTPRPHLWIRACPLDITYPTCASIWLPNYGAGPRSCFWTIRALADSGISCNVCIRWPVLCPVRYEYDGNDVYRLLTEEDDRGRVVALLIWVRDLLTQITFQTRAVFS